MYIPVDQNYNQDVVPTCFQMTCRNSITSYHLRCTFSLYIVIFMIRVSFKEEDGRGHSPPRVATIHILIHARVKDLNNEVSKVAVLLIFKP